jgi:hypothetical protein
VTDSQPANHYSTLSTIEHVFGLGCIAFTCDTENVVPYYKLFQVTGSAAIATRVLPEQSWPTPTPSQPAEPLGTSPSTASAGGWTTQQAQTLGTSDNSLGAVAGSSPSDVWARLPRQRPDRALGRALLVRGAAAAGEQPVGPAGRAYRRPGRRRVRGR